MGKSTVNTTRRKYPLAVIVILFFAAGFFYLIPHKFVKAQTAVIDSTVRISVCGDGVAENPEECDGTDMGGNSCSTFGYNAGFLSCEIDCTLNTSQCFIVDPPPDIDDDDEDDDNEEEPSDDSSDEKPANLPEEISVDPAQVPITPGLSESETGQLPAFRYPQEIAHYDSNNDGRIDEKEMILLIETWVNAYNFSQENNPDCDLNLDGLCTLTDFSLLMYYIN